MEISCPVSPERVNENVVRIIAFFVALIGICCVAVNNYYLIIFLFLDFGLRAFTSGRWSLLRNIANAIVKLFSISTKPTDLAPKKFAAKMGFIFCIVIYGSVLFQFSLAPLILTAILIAFAILESIFGICIGCHIYTLFQLARKKK
jgi:hypothetical protein